MSKIKSVQTLAVSGMLLALDVLLRRLLELGDVDTSFSLSFLVIAVAAYWYGPVVAGLVHGLADLLGAVLFPKGAPHIGLMVSAAAIGVIYGLFLYQKVTFWRIAAAATVSQLLISLTANSFWLSTLIGKGFGTMMVTRLPQVCIMLAIQIIVLPPFMAQIKKIPLHRK